MRQLFVESISCHFHRWIRRRWICSQHLHKGLWQIDLHVSVMNVDCLFVTTLAKRAQLQKVLEICHERKSRVVWMVLLANEKTPKTQLETTRETIQHADHILELIFLMLVRSLGHVLALQERGAKEKR